MDFTIKQLHTIEELEVFSQLEFAIWGEEPIPVHQTSTVAKNGGIILGGYVDNCLVGILYSFPGMKKGSIYLCSHILGFLPEYRGKGYGELMKEKQREIALQQGYDLITWTFDPLESANANLNIGKLKGVCRQYIENYYGDSDDILSVGLPTDRFLVERYIDSEHVKTSRSFKQVEAKRIFEISRTEGGYPVVTGFCQKVLENLETEGAVAVTMPTTFQQMKKDDFSLAKEWRFKTREMFNRLFSHSFVVVDTVRDLMNETQDYVLVKQEQVQIDFKGKK